MNQSPRLLFFTALILFCSTWFYAFRVLGPHQITYEALHQQPRGLVSDLYPRWLGARELLLRGRNPYSAEVTLEIQAGYYGRPLDPARPNDPKDEQRFAYPVYVVFLLAPTVILPFSTVQTLFLGVLIVLIIVGLALWLRVLAWKTTWLGFGTILVLLLGSFPVVQAILLQQLTIVVFALVALGLFLISRDKLFAAGIVLSIATIKPQLVFLLAAWLFLWTISAWRKRQNFAWGFLATLGLLAGGGEFLLHGWIRYFIDSLAAYRRYAGGQATLAVLLGSTGGMILSLICLLGLAIFCWRTRQSNLHSRKFVFTTILVLTVTIVVNPKISLYNYLLLAPAVLLVALSWKKLWKKSGMNRVLASISAAVFCWPWIASLGLMIASLFVSKSSLQNLWSVPFWTSVAIPLVVLGALALCANDELA